MAHPLCNMEAPIIGTSLSRNSYNNASGVPRIDQVRNDGLTENNNKAGYQQHHVDGDLKEAVADAFMQKFARHQAQNQ